MDFFVLKNLVIRIISAVLIIVICALCFFILRSNALSQSWSDVTFNSGIAWGWGDEWSPWVVYVIKIIPTIVLLLAFICFNRWYIYVPIFLIGINSLFNIIDKALIDDYKQILFYNTVVDYFYWPSINVTNNIADILIIAGLPLLIIGLFYDVYRQYVLDKQAKNKIMEELENEQK